MYVGGAFEFFGTQSLDGFVSHVPIMAHLCKRSCEVGRVKFSIPTKDAPRFLLQFDGSVMVNTILKNLFRVAFTALPIVLLSPLLWIASMYTTVSLEYISPRPGSKFVPIATTIAIRSSGSIDVQSVTDAVFKVIGSKSGLHGGRTFVAPDGKTVIFEPVEPFLASEKVSVSAWKGVRVLNVGTLDEFSFEFDISPQTDAILNAQSLGLLPSLSLPQSLPQLNLHATGISNYVTLPADFPRITVTVPATNTGDGYIFLGNFFGGIRPHLLILDN